MFNPRNDRGRWLVAMTMVSSLGCSGDEGPLAELVSDGLERPDLALVDASEPMAQVPGFDLDIARDGAELTLSWADAGRTAVYTVWRSPTPGFVPGNTTATVVAADLTTTQLTVTGAALGVDDYYRVRAVDGTTQLGDSTIVGEHNRELFAGNNQLGISLIPSAPTAAGLAADVINTAEIRSWSPTTGTYEEWQPWSGVPDIGIEQGESVWLNTSVQQSHGLMGYLPDIGETPRVLEPGYNTIVMPQLAGDMDAIDILSLLPNATSVSYWSGETGSWVYLTATGDGANFTVAAGQGFWANMAASGVWAPPLCGDGIVDAGEACDDGNWADGDGCEADCTETPALCGDGVVQPGEGCDDGNLDDTDGCTTVCEAVVMAYEPFEYGPGGIQGQGGALGFSGSWTNVGFRGGSTSVAAGSLSVPAGTSTAPSSGNRYRQVGDGGGQGAFRNFLSRPVGDGDGASTYYMAVLVQPTFGGAGGFAGVRLRGTSADGYFGWGNLGGGNFAWMVGEFAIQVAASTVSPVSGETVLLVARLDFTGDGADDRLRLYINPGEQEPMAADADFQTADFGTFNEVLFQNNFSYDVDEFRLASDYSTALGL